MQVHDHVGLGGVQLLLREQEGQAEEGCTCRIGGQGWWTECQTRRQVEGVEGRAG